MSYYIYAISPENYQKCVEEKIIAVKNRGKRALKEAEEGDKFVFYIGDPELKFVGYGEIRGDYYTEDKKLIWPDEKEKEEVIYPYRREIELKAVNLDLNVKEVLEGLSFVENKEKYGSYFLNVFFKISLEDYKFLRDKLKKSEDSDKFLPYPEQFNQVFRDRDPIGNPTLFKVISGYKKFYIPDFQRFFRWTPKNISQLLKDIEKSIRSETELFLGNMIFKEQTNERQEIIDGQQRIVSFFIILRMLLDSEKLDKNDREELKKVLANTTIVQAERDKVELLDPIDNFFKKFVLSGERFQGKLSDLRSPERNIISAKRKIKAYLKDLNPKEAKAFVNFLKNRIKVVISYVQRNEYEIYGSINSKGVELTNAAKIKNFLYKEASENNIDKVKKVWGKLFNFFNYSSQELSSFLKKYWTTNIEKAGTTFYKKFYNKFTDSSEENHLALSEKNSLTLSNDILRYAKIYKQLTKEELDVDYWGGEKYGSKIVEVIKNLRYLEISTVHIIFMQLRATFDEAFEKRGDLIEELSNVYQDIEKLSFLHIILFNRYPQKLKDKFSSWSIDLNKKRGKKQILKNIKSQLQEEINNYIEGYKLNDQLRRRGRVQGNLLKSRALSYMFLKIMKVKMNSNTINRNLRECEDKTIEHIMPKSYEDFWEEDIKSYIESWDEYKERKEQERVKKYVETYLNDIGNLSLLDNITNDVLGNKSFKDKKKTLKKKEKDNKLFEGVLSKDRWSFKEIVGRRKRLCEILKNEVFNPSTN